ncbi:unnamed protein product [Candida verbasci]|uniref:HMG box domain-containing protein n=1 Tax=Candida verbasci TaxID=1227364 RepID=A0A9W4TXA5_9ASCO|nr:unnamed protein product [Candida verbasci]
MLRSLIGLRVGRPIVQQAIGFRFYASATGLKSDTHRKKLENQLKTAKQRFKATSTKVKELESKEKQKAKDKAKREQLKEKKLKQKELDATKREKLQQAKLTKKATENVRAINLRGFIAFTQKVGVAQLTAFVQRLSQDELAKFEQAQEEYNTKKKSFFTPKPELPPTNGYNVFLAERYEELRSSGLENKELFKQIAGEWSQKTADEKAEYKTPKENSERRKEILKEWTQKRLGEYEQYLQWKEDYRFHL